MSCLEYVADRIPASRVVLYRRFLIGQETEVVSHSLLVSLGVLEQVQAQVADRKRGGIAPPKARELVGVGPLERDIQRSESLLAVKHGRDRVLGQQAGLRAVPVVLLMVLEHEVIELVPLDALGLDPPEEERSDRVVAHQAVKEPLDPAGRPHEFPLNRREDVFLGLDATDCLTDRDRGLERHLVFSESEVLGIRGLSQSDSVRCGRLARCDRLTRGRGLVTENVYFTFRCV